jgi:hypothetical protein
MELIKVLRLRPTVTSIEDRLSYVVVQETGYKGAISDVRLEVYVENVTIQSNDPTATSTSGDEFELKFIEITKVSTGQAPTTEPVKRYQNINGQFGDTRTAAMQYIIDDFITRNAYSILMNRKSYSYTEAQKQAPTYYKIVQDPWNDEPPLIRNYSNDPYFLNNGVELKVEWKSAGSSVVDGTEFSNPDGSESYSKSLSMPGKTPSVPFIQDDQDIEYAKSEKKKISKTIIGSDKSTGASVYYTISSNDIKIAGTGSLDASVVRDNFPGDVMDVDIINKFVDIWKKKVPNYNLKICQPSYYPSLVDLEFKSPLQSVSAGTPSNDNQSTQSNDPNEVKFKLSIVYDKNVPIKADADVPDIKIYVGEPPKDGEFLFDEDEFDDLSLLDDEYLESKFEGDGENILSLEEELANKKEAESNGGTKLDMPQGTYNVSNVEPDTPFDASKLPVPPGFNGVPLYHQYDIRWGKARYGVGKKMTCDLILSGKNKGGNIELSGCMPSSLAMMINYWAKKGYCKPTRPDIVGQFCVDYGGRVCGSGGNLTLIPADKFKEVFGLNIVAFTNIGDDKVRTLLKKGFPINHGGSTTGTTAKGDSKSYTSGHYLCLTGIDDQGRIRVNDSGNGPMGGGAITYYKTDKWSSYNTRITSQSYLYPDALGNPL